MKKLLPFLFLIISSLSSLSQTNPTLSGGLEQLTMNKGTIDVELLTKIIMEKQNELKGEALKRFMFKLFPQSNYATKYYIQSCLHLLINEKNPQVIKKELLELTTNYALALGIAGALNLDSAFTANADSAYSTYDQKLNPYENDPSVHFYELVKKIRGKRILSAFYFNTNLIDIELKRVKTEEKVRRLIDSINLTDKHRSHYKKLRKIEKLKRIDKRLFKTKQRRGISVNDTLYKIIKDELIFIHDSISIIKPIKKLNLLDKDYKRHIEKVKIGDIKDDIEELNAIDTTITKRFETIIDKLENTDTKVPLPFGLLTDVVSLSLSEIEVLRDKGFYKNQIDYRKGDFYLRLAENAEGRNLRLKLDSLKGSISKKIKPYVEHYPIINEFLAKSDSLSADDIIDQLKDKTISLIKSNLDINDTTGINNYISKISEATQVNNAISSVIERIKTSKLKSKKINELSKVELLEEYDLIETILNQIGKLKREVKSPIHYLDSINSKIKKLKLDEFITIDSSKLFNAIGENHHKMILELYAKKSKSRKLISIYDYIEKLSDSDSIQIPDTSLYIKKVDIIEINSKGLKKLEEELNRFNKMLIHGGDANSLDTTFAVFAKKIQDNYTLLIQDPNFFKTYLNNFLDDILKKYNINEQGLDTAAINQSAKVFSELYLKFEKIIETEKISLSDLNYIKEHFTKTIVELQVISGDLITDDRLDNLLNKAKIISPLLKIKLLASVKTLGKYDKELLKVFEFISNLDQLDKATTFNSIIDMLRYGSERVESNINNEKFKDGYMVFINAMKKYTLLNPKENYVEVDVASFLADLQNYYDRNNPTTLSPYFSIGISENIFLAKNFKFPNSTEKIENIGFATEKLGLKYKLIGIKNYGSFQNTVKDDIYLNKNAPFVNEVYGVVYGSGLLYSLANTSTNENFDFPHLGVGVGVRFYNALDFNVTLGLPFVQNANFGDNGFIGFSFDIPLGEYLEQLGQKNK